MVQTVAHPAGCTVGAGHHKSLYLRQHRAYALHHAGDAGTGGILGTAGQQRLGGVRDLRQAHVLHLKYANLVGCAEPVFCRPQNAVGHLPLPLEIQHAVHHMLQHLGTGNGPLFVDVAHDENSHALPLGQLHQRHGTLLHLTDAAGRRGHVPMVEGLDGVHDQDVVVLPGLLYDAAKVRLREDEQVL